MYDGIAKGSINNHSKYLENKIWYLDNNQAEEIPKYKVKMLVPRISQREFVKYLGNKLATKWSQDSPAPLNKFKKITIVGNATNKTMVNKNIDHFVVSLWMYFNCLIN